MVGQGEFPPLALNDVAPPSPASVGQIALTATQRIDRPIVPSMPNPSVTVELPASAPPRHMATQPVEPLPRHESGVIAQPPEPSPSAQGEDEDEKVIWRRLQTIFRRHQEKAAAAARSENAGAPDVETTVSTQPADGPSVQRRTSGLERQALKDRADDVKQERHMPPPVRLASPSPPSQTQMPPFHIQSEAKSPPFSLVQHADDLGRPSAEEHGPDRRTAPTALSSAPSLAGDADRRGSAQEPPVATQSAPQGGPTAAARTAATLVGSASAGEKKIVAEKEQPTTTTTPPRREDADTPQSAPQRDTAALTPAGRPDAKEGNAPSFDGVPLRDLPLQESWPVQRIRRTYNVSESDVPPRFAPTRLVAQSAQATPAAEETVELMRLSSRLAPGQPTQSSIELIPPRNPRPRVRSEAPLAPATQGGKRLAQQPIPPETELAQGLAPRPLSPHGGQVTKAPEPETPGQETIQTEIGALPADLWHLLGEAPPRRESIEETRTIDTLAPTSAEKEITPTGGNIHRPAVEHRMETGTSEMRPVPSAGLEVQPPAKPSGQLPQARPESIGPATAELHRAKVDQAERATVSWNKPNVIVQRSPENGLTVPQGTEQVSTEEPRAEQAPSAEGRSPVERRGGQLDMEELSQRVYAEIKRRLAIERERMR